jgi:hypothetical protein
MFLLYFLCYLFVGVFVLGIAKGLDAHLTDEPLFVLLWPMISVISLVYIIYLIPYYLGKGLVHLFTPNGK